MYLTAKWVWFCLTVSLLHLYLRLSVYQSVRPFLPLVQLVGWINNKYLSFIRDHIAPQYSKYGRRFCRPPYWTTLTKYPFSASSSLKGKLINPHKTRYVKANIFSGSRDVSISDWNTTDRVSSDSANRMSADNADCTSDSTEHTPPDAVCLRQQTLQNIHYQAL